MNNKQSNKLEIIRRTAVYGLMSVSVVLVTLFLLAVALGYKFNRSSGSLEQNALVQFKSVPSGASVFVDGKLIGSTTPTKYGVNASTHHFEISKNGYQIWSKDLTTLSGVLYWFDYAILIPKNREPKQVASFQSLDSSLTSPDRRFIIAQKNISSPNFDLIDLKNEDITIKPITIPDSLLSFQNSNKAIYKIVEWDSESRFVLVKVDVDSKTYWISLDTRFPEKSKNISSITKETIIKASYYDTSGNVLYVITSSGILKRIDTNSPEKSKTISDKVDDFNTFDSKWVLYKHKLTTAGVDYPSISIYRDGDELSTNLYQSKNSSESVAASAGNYKGTDYLAILKGNSIEIFSGTFPGYGDKLEDKMIKIDTMNAVNGLTNLSFSPESDYILVQFGSVFGYYYFEHGMKGSFSIEGQVGPVKWLNNDYIYYMAGENLNIKEFDGSNNNTIMASSSNQDIAYTENGKYTYAFQKTDNGYGLFRVKMIVD